MDIAHGQRQDKRRRKESKKRKGEQAGVGMHAKPEDSMDASAHYSVDEAQRYTTANKQIQSELTLSCMTFLALTGQQKRLLLDLGCGSGLSSSGLSPPAATTASATSTATASTATSTATSSARPPPQQHEWIGLDVAWEMLALAVANARCGRPAVVHADLSRGLPMRAGCCVDGAVSVSMLQWLCDAPSAATSAGGAAAAAAAAASASTAAAGGSTAVDAGSSTVAGGIAAVTPLDASTPLQLFMRSLAAVLRPSAPAVCQFYPTPAQAASAVAAARHEGLAAELLVDMPHATRARKFFLCARAPAAAPASAATASSTCAATTSTATPVTTTTSATTATATSTTTSATTTTAAATAFATASDAPPTPTAHVSPLACVCPLAWPQPAACVCNSGWLPGRRPAVYPPALDACGCCAPRLKAGASGAGGTDGVAGVGDAVEAAEAAGAAGAAGDVSGAGDVAGLASAAAIKLSLESWLDALYLQCVAHATLPPHAATTAADAAAADAAAADAAAADAAAADAASVDAVVLPTATDATEVSTAAAAALTRMQQQHVKFVRRVLYCLDEQRDATARSRQGKAGARGKAEAKQAREPPQPPVASEHETAGGRAPAPSAPDPSASMQGGGVTMPGGGVTMPGGGGSSGLELTLYLAGGHAAGGDGSRGTGCEDAAIVRVRGAEAAARTVAEVLVAALPSLRLSLEHARGGHLRADRGPGDGQGGGQGDDMGAGRSDGGAGGSGGAGGGGGGAAGGSVVMVALPVPNAAPHVAVRLQLGWLSDGLSGASMPEAAATTAAATTAAAPTAAATTAAATTAAASTATAATAAATAEATTAYWAARLAAQQLIACLRTVKQQGHAVSAIDVNALRHPMEATLVMRRRGSSGVDEPSAVVSADPQGLTCALRLAMDSVAS